LLRQLQGASIWNYIEDVETPDDFTVVFPWKERTLFAKQFFATEPIRAPYHIYGKWSDEVPDVLDNEDAKKELLADLQEYRPDKPIGTGPYYVDTVTASDLIMSKFEDYRLAGNVGFDGVRYLMGGRHEIGMAYALSGQTHGCGAPLRPDYQEALTARRPDLRVVAVTDLAEFGVSYNMRRDPYSDLRVRQALTHATDRLQLAQAGFPTGAPVTEYEHQVLQSMEKVWIGDDIMAQMTTHEHDPDKAEALLEEAGFSRGADGTWLLPDGTPWEVEINCPAGYGDWVLGCENLAAQWADFGIAAVCLPIDNPVWWPSATAGEYDVGFLWAGVHWSTAHPYTAMQRHYLGDGGKRSGLAEMLDGLTGPDGAPIDAEALVTELGAAGDQARQKEIVETLAWVANEKLAQMVWVEKQFHFCLFEDEVGGYPPTDDPLWMLAPGGMERVWVWLMINGTIQPQ
jgi:peptide/nickel transport system substrate-binding protein